MPPEPSPWMVAQAPWPARIQAGFTTRAGGYSAAPWDSLNLGDHVGDDMGAVRQNRTSLQQQLGVSCRFLRQVHGMNVVELTPESQDGLTADACWTDSVGLAASVLVADCLPILLSSPDGLRVAAAHAGWRGLAGINGLGVVESVSHSLGANADQPGLAGWVAWLGPCIGPSAFEVGPEVREAFLSHDPGAAVCFKPGSAESDPPRFWADLAGLARRRLGRCGVTQIHGNDGSVQWCTYADSVRFFSHRRDARRFGNTGRMAALIWRDR